MTSRDPQHLERFITALRAIKARHPHYRIGQIIENACSRVDAHCLFYVEDNYLADLVAFYQEDFK